MSIVPPNKAPFEGLPVYNGNGKQLNITDPRYAYQDNLPNTEKVVDSSTNNLYSTIDAATARAIQIGCNGHHVVLGSDGVYYYAPCATETWLVERLEQLDSALNFTYIGNYRVLSWDAPFYYVNSFDGWIIDTAGAVNAYPINLDTVSNAQITNDIAIDFRYSVDGETWSLWVPVGTALTGYNKSSTSGEKAEIFSIPLNPTKPFYPEFRFTSVVVNQDGTIAYSTDQPIDPSVVIVSFDLDLTYNTNVVDGPDKLVIRNPVPQCSPEKSNRPVVFNECGPFTFQPYNINKAINLYQDLSLIDNRMFGFETNYYSVQPQSRSKDVILKEWTLFDVVEEKCVKVMVPQNQFPDNKVNYDPFGISFEEPFEVHIDKIYFESLFGRGSQPRKRDIIYFPLTNRIYEINSTYLFRDFMYSPVYFKLELKKYNPKSNTYFRDPAYKEELDGIAINSQELFGQETTSQEEQITKPQQYVTTTNERGIDPTRGYVYQNLPIINYELNNNWTIILNQYYDLNDAFLTDSNFQFEPNKYRNAVRYRVAPKLDSNGEIAYSSWFSLKNYVNENSLTKKPFPPLAMVKEGETESRIVYNTYPYKHGLSVWRGFDSNPEGYVAIKSDANHSGGFMVSSVIDPYKFSVVNPNTPFSQGTTPLKMQKAQARNLISADLINSIGQLEGFRIDLIHSGVQEPGNTNFIQEGSIQIYLNSLTYNSKLQFVPQLGDWYGVVVNISNKYQQMSINIWGLSYDPNNPQEQTSELIPLHQDFVALTQTYTFDLPRQIVEDVANPLYGTNNNSYRIYTSPLLLSNIRIFNSMIDIDKQSIVLNQNVVRDSQLAQIIDNAKPTLAIPKILRKG
jgi:hypothetical protein